MNAQEARAKAERKGKVASDIEPLVAYVKKKIDLAIENREPSVKSPLKGLRQQVTPEQKSAVYAALRAEGYTVTEGFDAPHLDKRARQEDEVSW